MSEYHNNQKPLKFVQPLNKDEEQKYRRQKTCGVSTAGVDRIWATLDSERQENICDVCTGKGSPISGKPCICKGTGKMSVAAQTLREDLVSLENKYDRLKEMISTNLMHVEIERLRTALRQASQAVLENHKHLMIEDDIGLSNTPKPWNKGYEGSELERQNLKIIKASSAILDE